MPNKIKKGGEGHLILDLVILVLSILLAIYIWQTDLVGQLLTYFPASKALSAFVAGFFFTYVFTTVPAAVALIEIGKFNSIVTITLIGALGAIIGDFIIFRFVRDRLLEDLMLFANVGSVKSKIRHLARSRVMRASLVMLGGILIALPLPTDELGVTLISLSRITSKYFLPISFFFNAIGIFGVLFVSKFLV